MPYLGSWRFIPKACDDRDFCENGRLPVHIPLASSAASFAAA
jgi:hypothetical protein